MLSVGSRWQDSAKLKKALLGQAISDTLNILADCNESKMMCMRNSVILAMALG